jgi:hypothetical protein
VTDQEVAETSTTEVDCFAQLGVTSSGDSLTQKLVTTYNSEKNISSRLYLLTSDKKSAGYCDANYVGGTGCAEFDIQEANNKAMVYTTHTCQ